MSNENCIYPSLQPGALVSHIADDQATGIVTAFMVRGNNHSYEVQWGVEKASWHLDFELVPKKEKPASIGFWGR